MQFDANRQYEAWSNRAIASAGMIISKQNNVSKCYIQHFYLGRKKSKALTLLRAGETHVKLQHVCVLTAAISKVGFSTKNHSWNRDALIGAWVFYHA